MASDGFAGRYGFYEAVDYTPSRLAPGQSFAVVRSFMAHHEGMSFLSLAYALLDRPMQRRFDCLSTVSSYRDAPARADFRGAARPLAVGGRYWGRPTRRRARKS